MKTRLIWLVTLIRDILFLPIGLLMPRNRHKVVCGAWFGRQFTCSPKYFARYMAKQPRYRVIWIGEPNVETLVAKETGIEFVRMGSWRALWHQMTAKFYVYNINWEHDIGRFPIYGRVILLNTWHGIPNKMVGCRQKKGGIPTVLVKPRGKFRSWAHMQIVRFSNFCYSQKSYLGSSSPWMTKILTASFPQRHSIDRMICAGMPRNDILVQARGNRDFQKALKAEIGAILGISPEKRWYVYMPTWRHADGVPFSFVAGTRKDYYQRLLENQNAILIEKQHPKTLQQMNLKGGVVGNVCIVSEEQGKLIDVQELLLCADRLISDYSSCILDYSLLHRPVINYTYDYDFFNNVDSGLEYDLREYATGPFVYDEDELIEALSQTDDELMEKRKPSCEEHIAYEKGSSCDAFFDLICRLNGAKESE